MNRLLNDKPEHLWATGAPVGLPGGGLAATEGGGQAGEAWFSGAGSIGRYALHESGDEDEDLPVAFETPSRDSHRAKQDSTASHAPLINKLPIPARAGRRGQMTAQVLLVTSSFSTRQRPPPST